MPGLVSPYQRVERGSDTLQTSSMVGLMAFDHDFYAISGSDDEYDEYGVYQTDIDTSHSQANQYYGPMEYEETSIGRIQPVNDIVYFPKWYLKGLRTSSIQTAGFGSNFINLDFMSYVRFLNWMPEALKMPEPELVRSRFCCLLEDLRTRAQDFSPYLALLLQQWCMLIGKDWMG
ncbi:hypothetical protein Bca4012_027269 [Brassica carinata]